MSLFPCHLKSKECFMNIRFIFFFLTILNLCLFNRWFSRGPEYAVSLLCKGMYGFEYLLKEIAMNYRTKVTVFFVFL